MAKKYQTLTNQLNLLLVNDAFVAGIGFTIAAILKFKAHKNNPTQGWLRPKGVKLLNTFWDSIDANKQAELANLGFTFDTLNSSVKSMNENDPKPVLDFINAMKQVGLS